jgi:Na+-driven multidrug efflux pump
VLSEIRATLALALPLAGANLAQMALGLTDTIMVGSLGAVPLAAVGLGSGLYFTGVIVCAGVLSAVAPLAAFALGAGDRDRVGGVTASGLLLAAALTLPVTAAILFAERLLDLLGYDPALTPRSASICARSSGARRAFSVSRCCAACSRPYRAPGSSCLSWRSACRSTRRSTGY